MNRLFRSWAPVLFAIVALTMPFGAVTGAADAGNDQSGAARAPGPVAAEFQKLPKPGDKVPLGAGYSFVYGFTNPPKLGPVIMKVLIYDRDGKQDTSFVVRGDMDMPSMRGAHSTGEKEFSLSKRGAFLLPASIAMPGDWEFRFTFEQNGQIVFRGAYLFDI